MRARALCRLDTAEAKITPAMKSEDFAAAMAAWPSFFPPMRFRRSAGEQRQPDHPAQSLSLLHRIRAICGQVADLTKIEG